MYLCMYVGPGQHEKGGVGGEGEADQGRGDAARDKREEGAVSPRRPTRLSPLLRDRGHEQCQRHVPNFPVSVPRPFHVVHGPFRKGLSACLPACLLKRDR